MSSNEELLSCVNKLIVTILFSTVSQSMKNLNPFTKCGPHSGQFIVPALKAYNLVDGTELGALDLFAV